MKTFFKSVRAGSSWLIPTAIVCLVLAGVSLLALPAQAGAAEEKAKKAFADWKAAEAAVAAAQEKLADAQKALQNAMTAVAKSGGKPTAEQEAALAGGRAAVARAEAALKEAEKQELAARVTLESAIADLPDGPLKDQLKRERNFPSVVAANGLYTVKFDTPSGQLKVNLPDDMRAGDTISGTVVPEPTGRTEEERNANRGVLDGYVVEISGQKFPVKQGSVGPFVIRRLSPPPGSGMPPAPPPPDSFFDVFVGVDPPNGPTTTRARIPLVSFYPGPPTHPSGAIITPDPKITQPTHPSGAIITPDPKITQPTHPSGAIITPDPKITQPTHPSGAIITPDPKITQPTHPSGAIITPDPKMTQPTPPPGQIITIPGETFGSKPMDRDFVPGFDIPPLGQQGRPIVITGPFDGDSANTTLRARPQDFIQEPQNPSSGFGLLAESPRKAVFQSPTNVTGPMEVTVNEGDKQTTGGYRNVGVNLSAPKTSLRRGESTELKVEVRGLEGIKEPVPLHLTKGGVVAMQGGDAQTMSIKPAEVSSDGAFTTTRTITGIQAGAWNATATVVVYNICIQDDTDPSRVLLFMTYTGDFKFCPGQGSAAGATPLSSMDFTGGISVQAGDGLDVVTRNGAITAGDFRFAGGLGKLQVDNSAQSGSATVQTTSPKQTFTITDRDMRNNTCTCQ